MAAPTAYEQPLANPSHESAPRELSRLEILQGLRISTWEGSFSTIHATLTTGAFLTGFALWLGANNLVMGLITAIPTLAGLIQIVASYLAERQPERKTFTAWTATSGRALWLGILLLPLFLPHSAALAGFLALYTLSLILLNIPVPAWTSWMSDLVPPTIAGATSPGAAASPGSWASSWACPPPGSWTWRPGGTPGAGWASERCSGPPCWRGSPRSPA